MPRLLIGVVASCLSGAICGCSGSASRIQPSGIDPQGAASAAIEAYDKNADGVLSKEELAQCPALLSAIDAYDSNKDQAIDEAEIAARLQSWVDSRVGISNAVFYLQLDGRPLSRAKITLAPEPFLGDTVKPAVGDSDSSGRVGVSMRPEELPEGVRFGVLPGLYKIRVSHPAITSPEKYDEQTSLGIEVPPQFNLYSPPKLELTNK